jgi:hypothetical protein
MHRVGMGAMGLVGGRLSVRLVAAMVPNLTKRYTPDMGYWLGCRSALGVGQVSAKHGATPSTLCGRRASGSARTKAAARGIRPLLPPRQGTAPHQASNETPGRSPPCRKKVESRIWAEPLPSLPSDEMGRTHCRSAAAARAATFPGGRSIGGQVSAR